MRPDVPNILYVVNDVDYWIHHRLALASTAQEAGYRVSLAASPHVSAKKLSDEGIDFIPLSLDRFRSGKADGRLILQLRQLFGSEKFDIVHATTIKPLLVGGLALRSLPVKKRPAFVGTVAGLGRAFALRGVQRWMLNYFLTEGLGSVADHLVFENPLDAAEYVRSGIVDAARVRVVKGAGVDIGLYYPASKGDTRGAVRFLFASRLLKSKGVLSYAAAARNLKKSLGSRVEFGIAGQVAPSEPDGLNDVELNQLQNDPSLRWYGSVEGKAMPDLLRAHDVFVLPTSYPEGLPRSLLEAGACGLAVIAGDVPGTRALINPGQDGVLLLSVDPTAVEQAMIKLVQQLSFRQALAGALRHKILNEGYSLTAINSQYLTIYRQAQARHKSATGSF